MNDPKTEANDVPPNSEERAYQLLREMIALHESEIDCDMCNEKMECLAELMLTGQRPDQALEAIQQHLMCCHCCHTEFEALVSILRMEKQAALEEQ